VALGHLLEHLLGEPAVSGTVATVGGAEEGGEGIARVVRQQVPVRVGLVGNDLDQLGGAVVVEREGSGEPGGQASSTVPPPSVSATIVTSRSMTRLSGYAPGDISTTPPAAAALIAEPMVRWLPQPRAATRWGDRQAGPAFR
jgi:hypothetical protein